MGSLFDLITLLVKDWPHWNLSPAWSITRGVPSQEHVTSSPLFKGFVQTSEQPPLSILHFSTRKKIIDSAFIWVPLVTGSRKFKRFYETIFYLCNYLHNLKLRLYKYEINENLPHWNLLPLGSITRGVFSQEHVTSSPSFKGFVQTWEQPPLLIEHLST